MIESDSPMTEEWQSWQLELRCDTYRSLPWPAIGKLTDEARGHQRRALRLMCSLISPRVAPS